jgi:hypothetical protein
MDPGAGLQKRFTSFWISDARRSGTPDHPFRARGRVSLVRTIARFRRKDCEEMTTRARRDELTGWTMFAAVWLVVAGSFNVINGITAIHRSKYYVNEMLFSSLSTWGWIILVFGIIQLLAGYLVFARSDAGNLLGVAAAVIAAVLWFFFLFASPFGALLALIMNGLVIYGLTIGRDPA